jgi:hypothetical protein
MADGPPKVLIPASTEERIAGCSIERSCLFGIEYDFAGTISIGGCGGTLAFFARFGCIAVPYNDVKGVTDGTRKHRREFTGPSKPWTVRTSVDSEDSCQTSVNIKHFAEDS